VRRSGWGDAELAGGGGAADRRQAGGVGASLQPDVVVPDDALPGRNGALTARRILAAWPAVRILILSMHSEPSYVARSREAGASGYLLKNALDLELVQAVKQVRTGEWLQDPRLAQAASAAVGKRPLTTRELEVLQMIVAGQSNKDIAGTLQLRVNTVAVHRATIMDAIQVHNTADLVVHAIRHGLVSLA